jgi:RNase H-fold protein (predicted Holliday junction resolvase)
MTTQNIQRLAQLTSQLAETLMTAVICADEIRTTVHADAKHLHNGRDADTVHCTRAPSPPRPLLDQSTFSVMWQGKSLRLGNTRLFWLLDRLAQHTNQYVTHLELIQEVWEDEELTTATIRSVVRHLRSRLRGGGMDDLAAAIHGHKGHYILGL